MMSGDRVPDRLLAAAAAAAVPQLTATALTERFGPRRRWMPKPGPGVAGRP